MTAPLQQRWGQSLMKNYGTPPIALVGGSGGAYVTDATASVTSTCSAGSR